MEDSKIKMDVIFDIGANEGKWSRRVNEAMKRNPSFYLFEPNKGFNSKYEKLGFLNYYNVLLSDTEREVEFFGIGSTGDSYYKEIGNQLFNGLIPRKLKTISLDELREKERIPQPDFIKLDTQGSEIDIINGARLTLQNTKLVLMECPILAYNQGAPTIEQYLTTMSGFGFVPIELTESHIVNNKLVQIDIAFIKDTYLPLLRYR